MREAAARGPRRQRLCRRGQVTAPVPPPARPWPRDTLFSRAPATSGWLSAPSAGVTAARALADAGTGLNVVVLEGSDRSGGRLLSTQTKAGGAVDLGAMWIHDGKEGNVLFDRLAALGLAYRCAPPGACGASPATSRLQRLAPARVRCHTLSPVRLPPLCTCAARARITIVWRCTAWMERLCLPPTLSALPPAGTLRQGSPSGSSQALRAMLCEARAQGPSCCSHPSSCRPAAGRALCGHRQDQRRPRPQRGRHVQRVAEAAGQLHS